MTRRKRRGLITVGCLAIIAVVMAAAPRERLILPPSTRLIKAEGWIQRSYWWQSEHSVAIIGSTPRDNREDSYLPAILDTVTGKRTPIRSSTAGRTNLSGRTKDYSVSPDGKWFLWQHPVVASNPVWTACEIDGTRCVKKEAGASLVPVLRWLSGAWMPDGKQWVGLVGTVEKPVLDFKNTDSSVKDRYVPVRWLPTKRSLDLGILPNVLGTTQGGHLIATTWYPVTTQPVDLFDFSPSEGAVARKIPVRFPPEVTTVDEMALSPKGDRMAWKLLCSRDSQYARLLRRLLPLRNWRKRDTVEFWTSKLDGTEMREIGHAAAAPKAQYLDESNPHSIRWTPDGKKLSYIYKGYLYTVPAE